jgi:hypothetical protein
MMIKRLVVPAGAAALALTITPVLAAGTSTTARTTTAQTQCAQLERTIDAQMPDALPGQVAKSTKERQEGAQLCNSGKTEEGVTMLQRALTDAMYRG